MFREEISMIFAETSSCAKPPALRLARWPSPWPRLSPPRPPSTSIGPGRRSSPTTKSDAEIIVTGSRIKGVAAVGSSVIALDQTKIAQEPVTSANDLLRRVPQVVGWGRTVMAAPRRTAPPMRRVVRGSTCAVSAPMPRWCSMMASACPHGHARPVHRPFGDPLDHAQPRGGGGRWRSAIYGSDAIAGVVNFILRKNFSGTEFKARSGFTDDGSYNEQLFSAIHGQKWDSGYFTIAGEYTRNSPLFARDLSWYQDDNRYRGGRDLRVNTCNPGTITAGGNTYAIPAGGVTSANVGSLQAGTSNKCFYNNRDAVIPSQQRFSAVANFSQNLTDNLRLFGDGYYSYRDGQIWGNTDTFTATVPNTNPFFVSPVAGLRSETVTYSLVPELGSDISPYHAYSWNATAGAELKFASDWTGTVYYGHGESKDVSDRRLGVNAAALATALADTNPATALNVFGGANNPATLAKIHDNYFQIIGATKLDVANLQFSGSLLHLPGGKLRVAVGGEYRKEYTFTDLVSGNSAAQVHTADAGSRNVKALFGELYVPIFSGENAIPAFQQLTLSLAGRYEHYSDFGSTTNPKVGLTWKPVSGDGARLLRYLLPRPDLYRGVTGGGRRGPLLRHAARPQRQSDRHRHRGRQPQLKPETARTWSAGVEFAPCGAGLVATLTYFDIDYRNQIQACAAPRAF
jgi:iron complex outermembrane receptor protein